MVSASASAMLIELSRTRSIRPALPWVRLFHSSMRASTSSLLVHGEHRAFGQGVQVTVGDDGGHFDDASFSGSRPVISRSIQIRFCGFCIFGLLGMLRSLA